MSDYFQFWFNCFVDGMAIGKGAVGITAFICLVLWFYYGRDDEHKTYKEWEKKIKGYAKWLFIVLLIFSTIFVAPYNQYKA
jgi:hypothetical protein